MAPSELSQITKLLEVEDKNLLVGLQDCDDASVYKIDEKTALVQSLDFITPIVDDPFTYGQIAAANSLSDIFAMGAKVLNALNIVGFDSCNLNQEILNEILAGGASKVKECGGIITGGHTIETLEMYYGLSVTGVVDPKKIWRNNTPKIGDILILTKPLGSGILSTAIKADLASLDDIKEVSFFMSRLNQKACEVLCEFEVSSCTDITGFGLLGHAKEMAHKGVCLVFDQSKVPTFKSAENFANMGLIPAGSYKNFDYIKSSLFYKQELELNPILYDAQTSGGLLVCVSEKDGFKALKKIHENGDERAQIIGYITAPKANLIEVI